MAMVGPHASQLAGIYLSIWDHNGYIVIWPELRRQRCLSASGHRQDFRSWRIPHRNYCGELIIDIRGFLFESKYENDLIY